MLVIINWREWGVGNGEWEITSFLPTPHSTFPTLHSLLLLRDRDRLALRRQFELGTPQVDGHAEMLQIVSAQNPVLLESRSLVNCFEAQDHGARVVFSQTVDRQRREPDRLDSFLDAGGADDANGLAFDLQPLQRIALDRGLRDDGRGRACVDDEIERALQVRQISLGAGQPSAGAADRDLESVDEVADD